MPGEALNHLHSKGSAWLHDGPSYHAAVPGICHRDIKSEALPVWIAYTIESEKSRQHELGILIG